MANPNPNLENLAKGRGKKTKLGHKAFSVKLDPDEFDDILNVDVKGIYPGIAKYCHH